MLAPYARYACLHAVVFWSRQFLQCGLLLGVQPDVIPPTEFDAVYPLDEPERLEPVFIERVAIRDAVGQHSLSRGLLVPRSTAFTLQSACCLGIWGWKDAFSWV